MSVSIKKYSDLDGKLRDELKGIELTNRLNISQADHHFPGKVLSANQIVFAPGSSLILGKSSMKHVVIIANEIVLPGGKNQIKISTHVSTPKKTNKGQTGAPGKDGGFGSNVSPSGEKGGAGFTGDKGKKGDNAPLLALICKKINFSEQPKANPVPLVINAFGSSGGEAGDGGFGGTGGDGADAVPGFAVDINDEQEMMCLIESENAGSAGRGGRGGNGGRGGKAGDGGEIWLIGTPEMIEDTKYFKLEALPGIQGAGGNGEIGGEPGRPGAIAISPEPCKIGQPGAANKKGNPGDPGKRGPKGKKVDYSVSVSIADFSTII